MNIKKGWKAKLESAYSFLLKYSKITVNFEYIGQNTFLILVLYIWYYHIYASFTSFRDRDRDKRRDKYSTSSSKSHSNSNTEGGVLSSVLNSDRDIKIDKDKEQAKLEDEMQKRRERIEQWRAEKVPFIYYVSTFKAQNLV